MDTFSIFFNMKVCCVLLELPHQGDTTDFTQYTIFNINKKIILNYPKSAAMAFFLRTQCGVKNSPGKQAISVSATEVLLYGLSPICEHISVKICSLYSLSQI